MNESILKALMQLFATITDINDEKLSQKSRSVVKSFLRQHLNDVLVLEYLKIFEISFISFHFESTQSKEDKEILIHREILKLSEDINAALHQKEKYIVILRLLELITEEITLTPREEKFLQVIADSFHLDAKEYECIKSFVFQNEAPQLCGERLLIVKDKRKKQEKEEFLEMVEKAHPKYINRPGFDGYLIVLHITSVGVYFFRYKGKEWLLYNGHRLKYGKNYILEHGSIIKGFDIEPIYYTNIEGEFLESIRKNKIIFTGENISFQFKNSDNGIQPFSFSEESGQLIGVMGGSGVGKSTLLNILSGKITPKTGTITINNYNLFKEKNQIEGLIGYVPQDDLLLEELTVFENLYFNAKLCCSTLNNKELNEVVEKVLHDLSLEDTKHSKVGNILHRFLSGGQRKRLNIGLELIREPSVLFVDEPTSGLSSKDSEMVMKLLKNQAQKGKLVIVNIHQPSSDIFKMLDKLWILDRGGYVIYRGNPIDAIVYFKTASNLADAQESECSACGNVTPELLLQIIESRQIDQNGKFSRSRKTSPQEWNRRYKKKIESKFFIKESSNQVPKSNFKIPSFTRQFAVFFMRNFLSKISNRQYLLISLFEAPLLALILGYFTKYISENFYFFAENKNLPAYLFMSIIVALFLGMTISAEEIIKDKKILERESFLNLSRLSYLASKVIYLFLLTGLQMLSYVLIGNSILEIQGMNFSYWLILFSTACFANVVGLNISSGLNSVVSIYILVPFILVPQILFSGAIVRFDELHRSITNRVNVPWIGNIMVSRWAYEAMAVRQFSNNAYERLFFEYDKKISEANYFNSYQIPALQTKIWEYIEMKNEPENVEIQLNSLDLIQNEVKYACSKLDVKPFDQLNKINIKEFDDSIANQLISFTSQLKSKYIQQAQKIIHQKDQHIESLIKQIGEENLLQLKQENHNIALADIVLNRNDLVQISAIGNQFVQRKDPIFQEPKSKIGKAHFYSPVKIIGNIPINTFYFNLAIIWLMSGILFITLYFDILRNILQYYENIKKKKNSKQIA